MRNLVTQATRLAAASGGRPDTGHLLLALVSGQGTAAKLLKVRGLTPVKIKSVLRGSDGEPPEVFEAVCDKAYQIALPFQAKEPSALHLLAAVAGSRDSHAARILEEAGLDAMGIRTQALRCLTGITEDFGGEGRNAATAVTGQEAALPLAEELRTLSASRKPASSEPRPRAVSKPVRVPEIRSPAGGLRARELIELGRELERKQRRKRATQRTPDGAVEPTPVPEPGSEIVAEAVRDEIDPPAPRRPVAVESTPMTELALGPDRFPLLASFGRNLTMEAATGSLDEIVGRVREMERMADVLNKRRGNSPCLVGPSGVGKTALVEGLASRLVRGEVPGLEDRIVIELRPADLLSGTSVRGALSERLEQLRAEVKDSEGRVILFFDEIHALLGSSDGADAVQELKTSLGRGELPCIAATTHEEYARHVETDPALARRFSPIDVAEPSEEETLEILEGVLPAYREHHGVDFEQESLAAAVRLSSRYVTLRALPDKAIALLDLAGARSRRAGVEMVEATEVARVLAEQLDVPVERLVVDDHERLLHLEDELAERIVGHRHALAALGETLRRNAAGFRTERPIGSFLFLGPTGVGKTETAKALSDLLFPGGNALVRLDMSEFSESHAVARLIGAPPGYIGHEEGGQLTQAVRRRPYCLVLLDEIEKAHPDVLKVLLQVLDDGRLTDGLGRTVDFENTVIVMTSNLGSDLKTHRRQVGFGAAREVAERPDLVGTILGAVREALPPELWNRIDEPLVFGPLEREEVASIARLMVRRVAAQLAEEHRVALQVEEGGIDALVALGGYDSELGARPMRRTIQRLLEGPVARMVLTSEVGEGDTVVVDRDGDELGFDVVREEPQPS